MVQTSSHPRPKRLLRTANHYKDDLGPRQPDHTLTDTAIALEIATGSRPCDPATLAAADVSGDDRVTASGAIMILHAATGNIDL